MLSSYFTSWIVFLCPVLMFDHCVNTTFSSLLPTSENFKANFARLFVCSFCIRPHTRPRLVQLFMARSKSRAAWPIQSSETYTLWKVDWQPSRTRGVENIRTLITTQKLSFSQSQTSHVVPYEQRQLSMYTHTDTPAAMTLYIYMKPTINPMIAQNVLFPASSFNILLDAFIHYACQSCVSLYLLVQSPVNLTGRCSKLTNFYTSTCT